MLTNYHPTAAAGEPHRRCAHASGPGYGPIATTLRFVRDSLLEGLAAQRRYTQLTSRGVAHDPALRAALGGGAVRARCHHH